MIEEGKWPRCVSMLAELADLINRRCRQVYLRSPLLYRVFLARQLLRFLDKTQEPLSQLYENDGIPGEFQEWNYKSDEYPAWDIGFGSSNINADADCPPLVPCFDHMICCAVLPNHIDEFVPEDSQQTQQLLKERGLTLYHLPDYDEFVLLAAVSNNNETETPNVVEEPSIAAFCFYGGCYSPNDECISSHEKMSVLQLFMSMGSGENCATDFNPDAYLELDFKTIVLWYTLMQALNIKPFATTTSGVEAQTLWDLVYDDDDDNDNVNDVWNESFQYYNGLQLYKPVKK